MIIKPISRFFEDNDIIKANSKRAKELENTSSNMDLYFKSLKVSFESGDKVSLKNLIENHLFLEETNDHYIDILINTYNSLNKKQRGEFFCELHERYINKCKKGYLFTWVMYAMEIN